LQRQLHIAHRFKFVQAAAAGADFAGGLQAAQHQDGQHGQLVLLQRPFDAHAVLVLGHARAGLCDAVDVFALHQPLQHIGHRFFRQRHHRIAAR
jgi:hypothetical protein